MRRVNTTTMATMTTMATADTMNNMIIRTTKINMGATTMAVSYNMLMVDSTLSRVIDTFKSLVCLRLMTRHWVGKNN